MKSSIKIDFADNGNGLEPVIKVLLDNDPENSDPRDSLLKTFFQKLGGESSWLRLEFQKIPTTHGTAQRIIIYPITPATMGVEGKEMFDRANAMK
jgi:hypothetical protein